MTTTYIPKDITATMSPSKQKVASAMSLSPHEKKEGRVDFSIVVEERVIDNIKKLCFKCAHYSSSLGGDSKEELTSVSAFKKIVNDKIDYIAKELG